LSRVVRVLEAATAEATEAAAWYENEQPGLGSQFWDAIEAALDLIEEGIVPLSPIPGEAGRAGLRRLVLKRFPFSIVSHVVDNEIIIIAFAHHSRRPGYWSSRLPI